MRIRDVVAEKIRRKCKAFLDASAKHLAHSFMKRAFLHPPLTLRKTARAAGMSTASAAVRTGGRWKKVKEKGVRKTKRKPPMRFLLLNSADFFNQPFRPIRKQMNW